MPSDGVWRQQRQQQQQHVSTRLKYFIFVWKSIFTSKKYWVMNYNKNKRFFFWFIATEILKMVLEILNLRAIYNKKFGFFFKQTYWFNYLVQAIVARIYAWWFFSFLLLLVYYRPALYYYSWSLTLLIHFYCLI